MSARDVVAFALHAIGKAEPELHYLEVNSDQVAEDLYADLRKRGVYIVTFTELAEAVGDINPDWPAGVTTRFDVAGRLVDALERAK